MRAQQISAFGGSACGEEELSRRRSKIRTQLNLPRAGPNAVPQQIEPLVKLLFEAYP